MSPCPSGAWQLSESSESGITWVDESCSLPCFVTLWVRLVFSTKIPMLYIFKGISKRFTACLKMVMLCIFCPGLISYVQQNNVSSNKEWMVLFWVALMLCLCVEASLFCFGFAPLIVCWRPPQRALHKFLSRTWSCAGPQRPAAISKVQEADTSGLCRGHYSLLNYHNSILYFLLSSFFLLCTTWLFIWPHCRCFGYSSYYCSEKVY